MRDDGDVAIVKGCDVRDVRREEQRGEERG